MAEKAESVGLMKLQVLLLLNGKGRSGYELMREIGKTIGKKPSAGQIYPLLAKMKKLGHIQIEATGAREKKSYSLTGKGKNALKEMLARTSNIVEAVLAEKLVECEHCRCRIYEGAYEKKINGKMHYFCCSSCAGEKTCAHC